MKAVVYTEYGPPDVLQIEEVEKPTPNENQVMIKVHAASVNAGDYRVMRANPFLVRLMTGGLLKPKNTRLGSDVAGRVEAVGENVKQFRPGDEVFGCRNGAFAEYVCAREGALALKPANRSFEEVRPAPLMPTVRRLIISLEREEGLLCGSLPSMIFTETSPHWRLYSKRFVKQK